MYITDMLSWAYYIYMYRIILHFPREIIKIFNCTRKVGNEDIDPAKHVRLSDKGLTTLREVITP